MSAAGAPQPTPVEVPASANIQLAVVVGGEGGRGGDGGVTAAGGVGGGGAGGLGVDNGASASNGAGGGGASSLSSNSETLVVAAGGGGAGSGTAGGGNAGSNGDAGNSAGGDAGSLNQGGAPGAGDGAGSTAGTMGTMGQGGAGGNGSSNGGGGGGGGYYGGGGGGGDIDSAFGAGGGGGGSSYTAQDVTGADPMPTSTSAEVVISWMIPAAPTCQTENLTTPQNTSTTVTFQCSSSGSNNALTYMVTSPPSHGTLGAINGDQVSYTPNAGSSGPDSFSVTVTDSFGQIAAETINVSVQPATPTTAPTTASPAPTTAPPAPAPTALVSITPGSAGLIYRLSAGRSYATGSQITAYRWTLDGQLIGTTASIVHSFPRTGRYTVVLSIADASGVSVSHDVVLDVRSRTETARLTLHFAVSRAGLTRTDRLTLIKLRAAFAQASRVQITGYCAARELNDATVLRRLSLDRARMVLALLEAHHNRTRGRLSLRGLAASQFVASNRTAAGRSKNRRATLVITYARPLG